MVYRDKLADWLTDWQTDWLTERQTDKQRKRQRQRDQKLHQQRIKVIAIIVLIVYITITLSEGSKFVLCTQFNPDILKVHCTLRMKVILFSSAITVHQSNTLKKGEAFNVFSSSNACWFMSTEAIQTIRGGSPGRSPRLWYSSWALVWNRNNMTQTNFKSCTT